MNRRTRILRWTAGPPLIMAATAAALFGPSIGTAISAPKAEATAVTQVPPPVPFVPGAPWVQVVPWSPSQDLSYSDAVKTFCGPAEWQVRFFESGRPGYRSYSMSPLDVSQRPAGDPMSCPKASR